MVAEKETFLGVDGREVFDELFGSLDDGQLWNDDGELETVLDLLGDDLDRNRL